MKYRNLADWLRTRISSGEYKGGDRIPTENELSNRFGVSRDTVRKAIDELEQEGLIYKVRGSGTYVNDTKETLPVLERRTEKRTKRIGVLMNDVDDYIFPSIVRGISNVMNRYGYTPIIQFTYNNIALERGALEEFLKGDFDGVIIEPTRAALPQLNYDIYEILSKTLPAVLIHSKIPTLPLDAVTIGDEKGAYLLTKYLVSQGHTDIALIVALDEQTGTARYLGYVKALQEEKVPIRTENIFLYDSQDMPGGFEDGISARLRAALAECTAVMCQDDRVARKMQRMIQMNTEYNQKMVICGFDDSDIAKEYGFISVTHPKEKYGEEVALRLLRKIEHPTEHVSYDFTPEIVVREREQGTDRKW